MSRTGQIVGVIILVLLLVIFLPVLFNMKSHAENSYRCEENASYTFLNGSRCMNTSGTPPSVEQFIDAEDMGLTPTESVLLGLVSLFMIIAVVMAVIKKNN